MQKEEKSNSHGGHRERMYGKLDKSGSLYDHEVLEILLFSVCPRQNTNVLAHALLDRFTSISEVLKADVEELKCVKGVGDGVARFLKTVGLCAERAGKIEGSAVLKNSADIKNFVKLRMFGKTEEFLELYFMNKSGCVNRIFTYTSADRNKAYASAREIVRNIALAKPHSVLVAHNHPNGSCAPSASDDAFTKQISLIADMNNVALSDHVIYGGEDRFYSYRNDGSLDEITRKFSLGSIVEWISNLN